MFLILVVATATGLPTQAQPDKRISDAMFVKLGTGFSAYTGDFPVQNQGYPYNLQNFLRGGDGSPVLFTGELGYQFSPQWGLSLGFQGGNYPIVGYGGSVSGIEDIRRYTPQVLVRRTFAGPDQTFAPYLDLGANVTFGGEQDLGFGPAIGAGLDVALNRNASLFIESRFNLVFPDDAIDGSKDLGNAPPNAKTDNPRGSITGPFDVVGQLLGVGVKYNFSSLTSPRMISLNGPSERQVGESATFTARANQEDTAPLSYGWTFGDGQSGSGLTASTTYRQPGTYTVTVTAENEAGEASRSQTIRVSSAPEPARIISLNAEPNPVDEGELVRFSADAEGDAAVQYEWDFGDGTAGSGASSTHTYDEPGSYTARLTVLNEVGEDNRAVRIQVNRTLPEMCRTVSEMNSAFFERNSSALTDEARSSLAENAEILSQCPNLTVQVEGFAAPSERNTQELSGARAQSVAGFYEERGVEARRIQTLSDGPVEGVSTKKGEERQHRRADTSPQR